jgi:hypothetical protein
MHNFSAVLLHTGHVAAMVQHSNANEQYSKVMQSCEKQWL